MKSVLFYNRKGGVGKSTICGEFVLSLKRSEIGVSFYDLDQQGGTILQTGETAAAEVSAIDTPGALTEDLARWIRESDVVVIPVLPSSLEIQSLDLMLESYKANRKRGAKLVVVVNRFTHYRSSRDFLEWLQDTLKGSGATITTLMQSESIVQAQASGRSVVEFAPRSAAARSALEMVNTIRRTAGLPEERREPKHGKQ
jgi:cellulose biosynthesis protein BcsQ